MLFLRSCLFNIYLYALTAGLAVFGSPLLLLPSRFTQAVANFWSKMVLEGMQAIVGTKIEIRGQEHIPGKPAIFAFKHQSMWETTVAFSLLREPVIILKRELRFIPFFGSVTTKLRMISVDRKAQAKALRELIAQAKDRIQSGRSLLIFPEGTRVPAGEKIGCKPGVAALYTNLDVPCVPVALNSGLYWPRRKFLRRPGTIIVEFLPAIEPGLKRKPFVAELEERLEAGSLRLYEEGVREIQQYDADYHPESGSLSAAKT